VPAASAARSTSDARSSHTPVGPDRTAIDRRDARARARGDRRRNSARPGTSDARCCDARSRFSASSFSSASRCRSLSSSFSAASFSAASAMSAMSRDIVSIFRSLKE